MAVEIHATEAFTDLRSVTPSFTIRLPTRATNPLTTISEALNGFKAQPGADLKEIRFVSDWGEETLSNRNNKNIALLVTEGFEDLLELETFQPLESFQFKPERPYSLCSRDLVFGITERVDSQGRELIALQQSDLEFLVSKLRLVGVERIAICFLNSTKNPKHEIETAEFFKAQRFEVTMSHTVLPEGYETARAKRALTQEILQDFWTKRTEELQALAPEAKWSYRTYDGNFISTEDLKKNPVKHLLSSCFCEDLEKNFADISLTRSLFMRATKDTIQKTRISTGRYLLELCLDRSRDIISCPIGLGSLVKVDDCKTLRLSSQAVSVEPGPVLFGRSMQLTAFDCLASAELLDPAEIAPYKEIKSDLKLKSQLSLVSKQMNCGTDEVAQLGSNIFIDDILSRMASTDRTKPWVINGVGTVLLKALKERSKFWGLNISGANNG